MTTSQDYIMWGVSVIYMLFLGLSIAQVSIVISFWLIISSIGQIPAGIFADRYGYKHSMILGTFIILVGTIVFAFSNSFLLFLIGHSFMGAGYSLVQGADNAMIYESLKQIKKEDTFKKRFSRILVFENIFAVIASILGGVLYATITPQTPFLVQIVIAVIAFIFALSLTHIPVPKKQSSVIKQLKSTFKYSFQKPNFSKIFILSAVIGSISITTFQYLQPLYKSISINEAYFGLLAAGAFLMKGIGSWYSEKLGNIFSIDHYLVLHAAVFSLLLMLIQKFDAIPIVVIAIGVMFFLRGLYAPTVSTYINNNVSSDKRATILSINSQILFTVSSLSLIPIGYIAEIFQLKTAFFSIGMMSLIFLIIYVSLLRKVELQ